ncbi:hypothetical protein IQ06DRAFT_352099 [Phaeosphaeriaceae sp. SRC1lsM3a]|nr:hypothetical protein IQ06DRAFT_352099 [Stagonospora sp. SRC1lsM3a]
MTTTLRKSQAVWATIVAVDAGPTPPPPPQSTTVDINNRDSTHSTWTREEIITLVGVFVAVIGLLITLALSSPTLRHLLCSPYKYYAQRKRERARLQLRRRYEEWLAFQEWMEMSNGRHGP